MNESENIKKMTDKVLDFTAAVLMKYNKYMKAHGIDRNDKKNEIAERRRKLAKMKANINEDVTEKQLEDIRNVFRTALALIGESEDE